METALLRATTGRLASPAHSTHPAALFASSRDSTARPTWGPDLYTFIAQCSTSSAAEVSRAGLWWLDGGRQPGGTEGVILHTMHVGAQEQAGHDLKHQLTTPVGGAYGAHGGHTCPLEGSGDRLEAEDGVA